jgi:hypothetical protein
MDERPQERQWFRVHNRNRQTAVDLQTAPLWLFHSITSTGSASAVDAFKTYLIECRSGAMSEKPSASLESPVGPIAEFADRFFINYQSFYDPMIPAVRLIWCHYLFGMHLLFARPCRYLTLLRDPVSHFLSAVWFSHHSRKLPGVPNFEEWLKFGENIMSHDLARLFCHQGDQRDLSELPQFRQEKPNNSEAVRLALKNIENFYPVVGITERFEETLFLMADHLGFEKLPLWQRQMATKGRPDKKDLPERLLKKIEANVAADQELYDICKARFEKQLAAADFGPELVAYKEAMARQNTWKPEAFWTK